MSCWASSGQASSVAPCRTWARTPAFATWSTRSGASTSRRVSDARPTGLFEVNLVRMNAATSPGGSTQSGCLRSCSSLRSYTCSIGRFSSPYASSSSWERTFWLVNPDGPEHTRDSVENTDASASTAAWPTSPPSEWPTSWLNPPSSLLTATRSSPSSSSSYAAGSSGPGVWYCPRWSIAYARQPYPASSATSGVKSSLLPVQPGTSRTVPSGTPISGTAASAARSPRPVLIVMGLTLSGSWSVRGVLTGTTVAAQGCLARRGISRLGCGALVDEQQYVRADLAGLGQLQVGGRAALEHPLAATEHHRVHHQAVLVDQVVLAQRRDQRRATSHQHVAVVLLLEPGDLSR